MAIRVLKDWGLDYEGWDSTYLYIERDSGQIHQVKKTLFEEWRNNSEQYLVLGQTEPSLVVTNIQAAEDIQMEFHNAGEPARKFVVTEQLSVSDYNLFRTKPLRQHFFIDSFELNTPFWHALYILHLYNEGYMAEWRDAMKSVASKKSSRGFLGSAIQNIALYALEIGKSCEAIEKKKFEGAALTGLKVKSGLQAAAESTNLQHRSLRDARFERLASLIDKFGLDQSARICEKEGLGGWQAIKKQWQRHKQIRDT
ncbi:hypothetical protein C1J05_08660 [Sulfitobacter sp. JL08]|nr:hypothetical protein C1J05_08660 [Sulfitobacter sp. JL08]